MAKVKSWFRAKINKWSPWISRFSFAIAIILCIVGLSISYTDIIDTEMTLFTQRLTIVALMCAVLALWIAIESMVKTRERMRKLDEKLDKKLDKIIKALANPKFEENIEGKAQVNKPRE